MISFHEAITKFIDGAVALEPVETGLSWDVQQIDQWKQLSLKYGNNDDLTLHIGHIHAMYDQKMHTFD